MDSGVASSLKFHHIPYHPLSADFRKVINLPTDFKSPNKKEVILKLEIEHGRLLSLYLGNLAQILPRSSSPLTLCVLLKKGHCLLRRRFFSPQKR
ncbi:unnamed protein product [Thlaspi arvense]|uniref:Uncharacterized protein n=1 Tax=Thlaspi arvense TaxID=13288 RepID=A0AAU9RIB0_THLAR|nr:unnamed protein product [Thlaspi arvense]